MRKSTADKVFESIDAQEEIISQKVKDLSADAEGMKILTGYEWIKKQWKEVN